MTAYRSLTRTVKHFSGTTAAVNVTVTAAVIAGTSTAPAVTVTEGSGVTVTPQSSQRPLTYRPLPLAKARAFNYSCVIATAATTPAVTVTEGTGVSFTRFYWIQRSRSAVTVTEGTGVTVNVATVSSFWTHSRPDRYRRHRCHSCTAHYRSTCNGP